MRRLVLLTLCLWLAVAGVLAAWEVSPQDTARIYVYGRLARGSRLSGVLVAKANGYGYILTCAHGYPPDGNMKAVRAIYVWLAQGGVYEAQLVAVDRARDLSMLRIAEPPDPPIRLAAEPPAPGEIVYWGGFEQFSGRFIARRGRAGGMRGERLIVQEGGAVFGQSGGPMVNARHELVGITVETNGSMVIAVGLPAIRAFYKSPILPVDNF